MHRARGQAYQLHSVGNRLDSLVANCLEHEAIKVRMFLLHRWMQVGERDNFMAMPHTLHHVVAAVLAATAWQMDSLL